MSDNPSHRGGQEQGRPGQPSDDYYDDRYGRPQDDQRGGGQDPPRGGYAPDQGSNPQNPQQGEPNYPPRQGGSRDQGGYSPSYDQRTQSTYGPPSGGGIGTRTFFCVGVTPVAVALTGARSSAGRSTGSSAAVSSTQPASAETSNKETQ